MAKEPMGERLKAARKAAGYGSARSAAQKFGWKVSTYAAHENGQNDFGPEEAARYGRAFKTSPGWLLTGEDDAKPLRRKGRLLGKVGAGSAIVPLDVPEDEEIDLPPGAPLRAVAVAVDGDSMFPRYLHGEKLFYVKDDLPVTDLIGKECVIQLKDGGMLVKTIRRGTKPRRFNLESWNAPTLENQAIEWAAPVRWTERG